MQKLKLKAFKITVTSGSQRKLKKTKVVLAPDKVSAGRMAQLYPSDIARVTEAGPLEALELHIKSLRKPDGRDIRSFYMEIRSSLRGDPSLPSALRSILPIIEHPALAAATLEAVQSVDRSEGTDRMLDAFLKVLPIEHVERIRAAQATGTYEEVIQLLAKTADRGVKFKNKLIQVMFTPTATIISAFGLAIFLSVTQLPAMAQMFKGSKTPLPVPTQMLMNVTNTVKSNPTIGALIVAGIASLVFFTPHIIRSSRRMQDIIDKLPVLGVLLKQLRWGRSLRTLAMLLDSNMNYERALGFTLKSVSHIRTKLFFTGVREHIALHATDLYEAARANEYRLGGDEARWISLLPLGTATGSMPERLMNAADDYEERAEEKMEKLPKVLDLTAMFISGAIVGFVVMASVLPGFRLMSVFK